MIQATEVQDIESTREQKESKINEETFKDNQRKNLEIQKKHFSSEYQDKSLEGVADFADAVADYQASLDDIVTREMSRGQRTWYRIKKRFGITSAQQELNRKRQYVMDAKRTVEHYMLETKRQIEGVGKETTSAYEARSELIDSVLRCNDNIKYLTQLEAGAAQYVAAMNGGRTHEQVLEYIEESVSQPVLDALRAKTPEDITDLLYNRLPVLLPDEEAQREDFETKLEETIYDIEELEVRRKDKANQYRQLARIVSGANKILTRRIPKIEEGEDLTGLVQSLAALKQECESYVLRSDEATAVVKDVNERMGKLVTEDYNSISGTTSGRKSVDDYKKQVEAAERELNMGGTDLHSRIMKYINEIRGGGKS